MKCRALQRHLLSLADPRRPPPAAADHLEQCSLCRDWLHRVLQIERAVTRIPVPPPVAKAALWPRLQESPAAPAAAPELPPAPLPRQLDRRRVLALAASVLLLLGGVGVLLWKPWAGPPQVVHQPPAPDPFIANLMQRNLSLARADTPLSRVVALASLADDLQGQVRGLAWSGSVADLQVLAGWFEQVVEKGIVRQARNLPNMQRPAILPPVANRLVDTEREAIRLAQEHAACAEPLRALARAARLGYVQLRPLYVMNQPLPLPGAVAQRARPSVVGGPVLAMAGLWSFRPLLATTLPPAPPDYSEQVRRFHRNRELIEALVDGGLRLAANDNPQERADCCLEVAEHLAAEIRLAAQAADGPRATELARHLQAVLENGVSTNLTQACARIPIVSPANKELLQLGRQVLQLTQPLEALLQAGDADQQLAAQAIAVGRLEVEKVLRPRGLKAAEPL